MSDETPKKWRRGNGNRRGNMVADKKAKLVRAQRRDKVVVLSLAGMSFAAIAAAITRDTGIPLSRQQAQKDLAYAMRENGAENSALYRMLCGAGLKKIIGAHLGLATSGTDKHPPSPDAAMVVIRAIKELAIITGARVEKHELTGADGVMLRPVVIVPAQREDEDETVDGAGAQNGAVTQ